MNAIDALIAARDLLSDRNKWTKEALAFDSKGKEVTPFDEGAICWCASGAIYRVSPKEGEVAITAISLMDAEVHRMYPDQDLEGLSDWNDDAATTHDQVIRMFDRAIASAR